MRVLEVVDSLTQWLNEKVCPGITLKIPDDDANTDGYAVREGNPVAYPLYIPGEGKIPDEGAASAPSICVQVLKGKDSLKSKDRIVSIQLTLSTWNPGMHGGEIFIPENPGAAPDDLTYKREKTGEYRRSMDGYRDVLNFVDHVLNCMAKTEFIDGMRVLKEPVEYGQFQTDGIIWDDYPYWHMWISFDLETGAAQVIPDAYKDFL